MLKNDVISAHKYCTNNREQLNESRLCGCFFCLNVFSPKEITEWIKDSADTAVCPFCNVDSVIGDASGYPINDEFLQKMKEKWFYYINDIYAIYEAHQSRNTKFFK